MKNTPTEMKNNIRGTTVKQRKPRIKSAIWNIRKQNKQTNKKYSTRTAKRKMNPKI